MDGESPPRCCRAIAASPSYAEAHCNLGVICRDAGQLEEAVACYEAALAAAPSFAIVQQNLAIALTELGTRAKLAGAPAPHTLPFARLLIGCWLMTLLCRCSARCRLSSNSFHNAHAAG